MALEIRGRLKTGEVVLAHGAAGGTGTAAPEVGSEVDPVAWPGRLVDLHLLACIPHLSNCRATAIRAESDLMPDLIPSGRGSRGRFRRGHWVPIPRARDIEELNRRLLAACHADEGRTVAGREQGVGAAMLIERGHLLPLAEEGFDLVEVGFPTVSSLGCVKVKTNAYSVPVKAGATVEARLTAATVEIWYEGKRVARHERSYGRHQEILDLEHYLDVLERKPGALAGSKPLEQWRRLGRWPESCDRFWQALIALLQLGRVHGQAALQGAIDAALVLGCTDEAAVRHLVTARSLEHAPPQAVEVGPLAQFERPLPTVGEYDQLLAPVGSAVAR